MPTEFASRAAAAPMVISPRVVREEFKVYEPDIETSPSWALELRVPEAPVRLMPALRGFTHVPVIESPPDTVKAAPAAALLTAPLLVRPLALMAAPASVAMLPEFVRLPVTERLPPAPVEIEPALLARPPTLTVWPFMLRLPPPPMARLPPTVKLDAAPALITMEPFRVRRPLTLTLVPGLNVRTAPRFTVRFVKE